MKLCAQCSKVISEKVSRESTCPFCGAWLRSCVNCKFYSPGRHNDCLEPQAEYVRDERSSNFCDFFVFKESNADLYSPKEEKKSARDAFNKLFGDSP